MLEPRVPLALAGALAAVLLGSCATGDPGEPPLHWAINRSSGGGFYRMAYFTDAQLRDPRWEARRMAQIRENTHCLNVRIIRRDVRWYPATERSRRRCAAVVYTYQCMAPIESLTPRLNENRIEQINSAFGSPIEADCGEKDDARWPPPPPPPPSYHQPVEELLSDATACGRELKDNGRQIRVGRRTRVQVRTILHPALANAPGLGMLWYLVRAPEAGIGFAMYRAELVRPNFEELAIPNDGTNILVVQEFAPNSHGSGYCVRLTARQGGRVWQRRIERREFVEQLRPIVGIDEHGLSRDPSRFWSPATDAKALAAALGDHLVRGSDRDWYPPL